MHRPILHRAIHRQLQRKSNIPPTISSPTSTKFPQFESVERGFPISPLTEIGVYNLLKFNRINFIESDPDLDGNHLGLAPHTYPNAAAFNALTETVDNLLVPNVSSISIDYIESTLSSFTPKSFWYGCVLPSPITAGSLPESCNITATGFSPDGKLVAEQSFAFKANGSVIQDQNFGKFQGNWDGVGTVAFGVKPTTAAAFVDNFIAVLKQEGCKSYYEGSYNNGT